MKLSDIILYTDVDGTAIYDHKQISQKNTEAINELINEGGLFGVASGRTRKSIIPLFPDVNMPYIEANGAIVYDPTDKMELCHTLLNCEFKKRIYEFIKDQSSLKLTALTDNTKIVQMDDARDYEPSKYEIMKPCEFLNSDVAKCAIISDRTILDKAVEKLIKSDILNGTSYARSDAEYFEIFDSGTNKGAGIQKAISHRKLTGKILVCIGDSQNDIEMLNNADIALCPDNAILDVKSICTKILPHCKRDTLYYAVKYLKGI